MLDVVEDDERAGPRVERLKKRVLERAVGSFVHDAARKRAEHDRSHLARHACVAHVAKPNALPRVLREAKCETRFSDARGSDDRHDARALAFAPDTLQIFGATHEARCFGENEAAHHTSVYHVLQQRTPTWGPCRSRRDRACRAAVFFPGSHHAPFMVERCGGEP